MNGARSPFRTRLGSEGHYGFRLVFESESGMRTQEPKPGASPELCVELDVTAPTIAIHPPEAIAGQPGKVRLSWEMKDRHLDDTFVRLEYSEDGTTWQPINSQATSKHSVGRTYEWTPPPGLPPRVLLRVTARDLAGNYAMVTSNQKAVIDLVAPEGKLTGLRTPGPEPEPGPMPREVQGRASAVPEMLRPVLPVLLSSPSFADGAIEVSAADGRPDALAAAQTWTRRVTDTDVTGTSKPARAAVNRGLIDLLVDHDWKPSAATPDSCRWEADRPAPRPFFDGAIDIVVPVSLPTGLWVAWAGR